MDEANFSRNLRAAFWNYGAKVQNFEGKYSLDVPDMVVGWSRYRGENPSFPKLLPTGFSKSVISHASPKHGVTIRIILGYTANGSKDYLYTWLWKHLQHLKLKGLQTKTIVPTHEAFVISANILIMTSEICPSSSWLILNSSHKCNFDHWFHLNPSVFLSSSVVQQWKDNGADCGTRCMYSKITSSCDRWLELRLTFQLLGMIITGIEGEDNGCNFL